MSTLQNEMILESLFEEMLSDLKASQTELKKSVQSLEALAEEMALERFEDLCQ